LQGARLLLVEDNDMNQELALDLLGQAGITVVIANNGQESLAILAKDTGFDGILMDYQMPVMDGYTATREIRKNPQLDGMPVIAMTANAMAGDREKALESGMSDHIAKPLNVEEMFATIARWVKPQKPPAGLEPTRTPEGADGDHRLPDELPGIDLQAGLATTLHNTKLYLRMLTKFRDSQSDFGSMFSAARQDTDPTAAERAAHTLKGTAGNIGARGVQAAAAALEQACREGHESAVIDQQLSAVLSALGPVIAGLQEISRPDAVAPASVTALPREELLTAFDRLKSLLRDSDSEAGDLLDGLLEKVQGTMLAGLLKPVADAVEAYDFDDALALLEKIEV
ncbi:MAG: response regulator, partial [Trichlorobacter sp.]|uniref:response regulator n=1 Tax=Trichlorobacter sp. TaxID=2911007 RepID=UPI00256DAFA9